MNRKHYLLDLFNGVEDRFVVEAVRSREPARPVARKNRIVLIAALVALTALLAGCGAAIILSLQNMSVGTSTHTKRFDDQGKALEQSVEVQRQILYFAGYPDSSAQEAAREWFDFRNSYDQDRAIRYNLPNVSDLPDVPNNYEYIYNCYSPEMVRKLDEIAAKYNVKLLDEWVTIQRWQSDVAMEALGITSFLKDGAPAKIDPFSGMLYPPYAFDLDFELALTGGDAAWTKWVSATAEFNPKGYLPSGSSWSIDPNSVQEWNYTTADGIQLLMAMDNQGRGLMVAEKSEGFLVVSIDGNTTGSSYPTPDQLPGKEALEQMAEVINFSFQPQAVDAAAMQPKLDAAEEAYQAEHTYADPTYGSFTEYMEESNWLWPYDMQYTFYDINEDGTDDLLLGFDGMMERWCSIQGGTVEEHYVNLGYLCQDGILEAVDTMNDHCSFLRYTYFKLDKGAFVDSQPETLTHYKGSWYNNDNSLRLNDFDTAPTITEEDAKAIRAKHPHIQLEWKPIFEYPLDGNGTTLGDYAKEQDVRLSDDELIQVYTDMRRKSEADWYTHYAIRDINGDGVKDLLLSGDGETYWVAYTYRYGAIQPLLHVNFTLCEDGVIKYQGLRHEYSGIEIVEYEFLTLEGFEKKSLDYTAYDKSTASWMSDYDFTPMSEADAQAILAKYTRIDQGMRPIGELIG